jgi:hypothetical protein
MNDLQTTVVPSYFQQSAVADAVVAGIGGQQNPRISIRASRFRIVDGGSEETLDTLAIQVVVVGANPTISKEYYAGKWDPENTEAPDCYSNNGVVPDMSVAVPQAALCAQCPQNVWGSKISDQGKEIKACADKKRLAIVSADDVGGTVYELAVTPAALKNLGEYADKLRRRNIPLEGAITKLSFDDKASYPLLTFDFAGYLSQDAYLTAKSVAESDHVQAVIRFAPAPDAQAIQRLAAPVAAPALPAPAPVPQPQQFAPQQAPAPQQFAQPAPAPMQQPQFAPQPQAFAPQQAPQGIAPAPTQIPPKRGRRTKAEMEAAAAAAQAQQAPQAFAPQPAPMQQPQAFAPQPAPVQQFAPQQPQAFAPQQPQAFAQPAPVQQFAPQPAPVQQFAPQPAPVQQFAPQPAPVQQFAPQQPQAFAPQPAPVQQFAPQQPAMAPAPTAAFDPAAFEAELRAQLGG